MYKHVKVHETRSHSHASSGGEEERMVTRKQKADEKAHEGNEQASKKSKSEKNENAAPSKSNGKKAADAAGAFDKFCKIIGDHLSIEQMRKILEANGQDSAGSDDAVVPRWLVLYVAFRSSKCVLKYCTELRYPTFVHTCIHQVIYVGRLI